ncbi:Clp protease N-terminal domain-containing protein [Nonomuraea sp. KM88]|uniref:Clp protease N-terminal domain-containing protein n=1 Tax=Nonomuraea sp. KM88 TaxID=3457427 RepID=UPI003FCE0CAB
MKAGSRQRRHTEPRCPLARRRPRRHAFLDRERGHRPHQEQARREAAELGHRYVGTEHLLLGLLHEDGAEAPGVGLRQTRDRVVRVLHGDDL